MKKIDLNCPKCNAIMHVNADKSEAVCEYCGYKFLIEKEETLEEAHERVRRLAYAEADGKNRANEESVRRQKRRKRRITFLTIAATITFLYIIGRISYMSMELIDDPFENISVVFSGVDGSGEARIEYKTKNPDIEFELSKDSGLKEGEKIEVRASSSKYRFNIAKKEYTVEGLLTYIKSLDEINDKVRKYLNDKTYSLQKSDIEDGYSFSGEIVELNPYKIYLGVIGDKNIVFDIFTIKIRTRNNNIYDKFVVTRFNNVLINDDEVELLKFSETKNIGNMIDAGNPKQMNGFASDYAGIMTGFYTMDDIDTFLTTEYDVNMKIYRE